MNPLKVGTRVKTKDTKLEGTVRFCGEPQFANGIWVGVELDTENGKNDGEVKGVRYFQCQPQHGLFCKPDKLTKVGLLIFTMSYTSVLRYAKICRLDSNYARLLIIHRNIARLRSQP